MRIAVTKTPIFLKKLSYAELANTSKAGYWFDEELDEIDAELTHKPVVEQPALHPSSL